MTQGRRKNGIIKIPMPSYSHENCVQVEKIPHIWSLMIKKRGIFYVTG